jgi:hypothetical protein
MLTTSFYANTTKGAFERVYKGDLKGLAAIARNFLLENILRYEEDTSERLQAFESYRNTDFEITIKHILQNGMYPFSREKREETIAKAREISLDKEKMNQLVQKTSFCTNWKHASGYDEKRHGPCRFAHTIDDYNPPLCLNGVFCEKDQCDKNHGLSKPEWILLKGITVPVAKKEMKEEFCRCVWTKKRCGIPECPFMHSIWELLENFPEYKKLDGMELMSTLTIPCKAFRSTEQNKKAVDAFEEVQDEVQEDEVEKNNEDDEEDEEDDGPVIKIDQVAIKTFFENFDVEQEVKRQYEMEMAAEMEFEIFQTQAQDEPEYTEYVKTMSTLLEMPKNQLQKMVENGKQHIIDEWLQRKIVFAAEE